MSNPYGGGRRQDSARISGDKGGRAGEGATEHPSSDQVDVQFQSVLRIRPLSRKEREDHVVLEGVPGSGKDSTALAVIHPFFSEEAGGTTSTPRILQRGNETEFHFNHLLPTSADQDKAYYMIGLPMALAAMEPLKGKNLNDDSKHNNNTYKTHLVVSMGTSSSGKTYTTFGKSVGKRRNTDDGLVPRILDSLFSQSKHQGSSAKHHGDFAVRISLLQVDASTSSPSTSPDDAPVRDLLQEGSQSSSGNPVRSRSPSPMSRQQQRNVQSVKARIASLEHLNGSDGSTIRIEQDDITKDYRVVNAIVQTCRDLTEARDVLQQGLARKKRGPFGRTIKGHTLVTLQPVLLEPKSGSTAVQQHGGMIAILDMASSKRKNSLNGRSAVTMKDNMADNSTLGAVMHCLRTLQHNANVLAGRSPTIDIFNDDDVSVDASEISCVSEWKKDSFQPRHLQLKTVPYRQSKLTMLLQPFFSPRLLEPSFQTIVTILFTAYPGHRDYIEKKSLLNDLELLHGIGLTSERQQTHSAIAVTGLNERERHHRTFDPVEADQMLGERTSSSDDQDSVDYDPLPDAVAVLGPLASAPPLKMETDSLAFSESMDDEDAILPPPYAPMLATAPELQTKTLIYADKVGTVQSVPHHATSMTRDAQVLSPKTSRTTPMDFPGVDIPASTKPVASTATTTPNRSRSPNRQVHFPTLYSSAMPAATMLHQVAPIANPHSAVKSPQPVSSTTTNHARLMPESSTTKQHESKSMTPKRKSSPVMEPRKEDKSKSATLPWHSSPMKSINKVVHASRITGIKVLEKITPTRESPPLDFPQKVVSVSRPPVASSPVVAPTSRNMEFDVNDSASKEAMMRKIQYLEDHNKDLMKELSEIATRCAQLEDEKGALARQLRDAHRRRLDSEWTALDEQEWQQSRKNRMDQQQLIRTPLQDHLRNVQSTFQMRNQWLETGKPHFELMFPGRFHRASALDQRDRAAAAALVEKGARAPPSTPLSAVKKSLVPISNSHEDGPNGSNRKRMQMFQQLLESEHRKRLRNGPEK